MSNIIEITDFLAPELDVYARLTEVQLLNREHPELGLFIAESPKVIQRDLDAGCVPVSILVEKKHIEGEARDILAQCGDIPAYTAEEKLAVILGTEGDGLADSTISGCDYTVRIPMSHGVDSLNVAAASAVTFWQLGSQD